MNLDGTEIRIEHKDGEIAQFRAIQPETHNQPMEPTR